MSRSVIGGIVLSVLLIGTSSVRAQAFAVPVSDRVVEGDLFLPEGAVAHFIVREGTMVTIHDEERGYWYGFIPLIDEGEQQVQFTPFKISPKRGGGQHVAQLVGSEFDAELGMGTVFPSLDDDLGVSIKSIQKWLFPNQKLVNPQTAKPSDLQKIFGASGGGICCVSCGALTVCGGSVSMSCGACDGSGGRLAV